MRRPHLPLLTLGHALCLGALAVAGPGCVEQGDDKPSSEDLALIKQNLLSQAPTPKFPVNADLDGKVVYLGLDVGPLPIEPGHDIKLVHYWKVVEAPGDGWRLFVHANGPNNGGFANFDHGPIRGKYPVSQWKAGDIVRDEDTRRLPTNWGPDKVEIYVGLWKGADRMTIRSGPKDDTGRVLAASLPVIHPAAPPVERKGENGHKYIVRKASKPIKVDGVLDEQAWKDAPAMSAFVNTLTGEPVHQGTQARMLWDKDFLYIGAVLSDTDVWGNFSKRDDKLWQEEALEIMIDANGDGKSYVELQVSPKGTVFDSYLPTYRKYEDSIDPTRKPYSWDSKVKVAVQVDGTLNKRDDVDRSWTVELALPLADANGLLKGDDVVKVPPGLGDVWRLNLYRLDVARDSKNENKQEASAWSPPLVGDFHKLDRFGFVTFADEAGRVPDPAAAKGPKARAAAVRAGLNGLKAPSGPGDHEPAAPGAKKAAAVGGGTGDHNKK